MAVYKYVLIFFIICLCKFNDAQYTRGVISLFGPGLSPRPGDIPVLNRKIFRGMRVTSTEFPFMASIRRKYVHYLCGVIISPRLILTIAHPIDKVPIYELGVVLGQTYADRGNAMHTVIIVLVHPDFNPYTLKADLAFLVIYDSSPYKATIKNVPIWENLRLNLTGKTGFITGWGRCDLTGSEMCLPRSSSYFPDEIFDPMLKRVKININMNVQCDMYRGAKTGSFFEFTLGTLCLGEQRAMNPVAPCMAVPGAPLVVHGGLLGLQSWGYACGYKYDLPIVYTSIAYYARWIIQSRKIFKMVHTTNLMKPLYEATKSYILYKWLNSTRDYVPIGEHAEEDIQALELDRALILLNGKVYDIRDYIDNGRYHKIKEKIYELLQATTLKEKSKRFTKESTTKVYNRTKGKVTLGDEGRETQYVFSDDYDDIKDFPRYNPDTIF